MNSADTLPTVTIQVAGTPGGPQVSPEMSSDDFIAASPEKLRSVAQVIESAVGPFFERLTQLARKPSECTVEFGVNVGGEAGVPFVTKGTVGANFAVALKWTWEAQK